jgi:hypothetical protein
MNNFVFKAVHLLSKRLFCIERLVLSYIFPECGTITKITKRGPERTSPICFIQIVKSNGIRAAVGGSAGDGLSARRRHAYLKGCCQHCKRYSIIILLYIENVG